MSNAWERDEGVLLESISFLANRNILKVFMSGSGLMTLITPTRSKHFSHVAPFCRAEWLFRPSKGEMCVLKEVSFIDAFLELRTSYELLQAAGSMAKGLLRSQLPRQSSPELYNLFLASLRHLPQQPMAVSQSFRLKLLRWEGLLRVQKSCSYCPSPASCISRGESTCSVHANLENHFFDVKEWELLCQLDSARRFVDLKNLEFSTSFLEKLESLFHERILS